MTSKDRARRRAASKGIDDAIYAQVADEISRKEMQAGLLAKAAAEAKGNALLAQSLYISYRAEQLAALEIEARENAAEDAKKEKLSALAREFPAAETGSYSCSRCGYRGGLRVIAGMSLTKAWEYCMIVVFLLSVPMWFATARQQGVVSEAGLMAALMAALLVALLCSSMLGMVVACFYHGLWAYKNKKGVCPQCGKTLTRKV